jgi:GNAT superfamily N-acetyltransferase
MPRSAAALAAAPAFDDIEIDTDKARLDFAFVHGFLRRSRWAKGIPAEVLRRALANSTCFGVYKAGRQIGFARVVTDFATFAYLADVFIVEAERGHGYADRLVEAILAHPELQGLRRWLLGTRDAHGLYQKHGFAEPPPPFAFLELLDDEVYARYISPV